MSRSTSSLGSNRTAPAAAQSSGVASCLLLVPDAPSVTIGRPADPSTVPPRAPASAITLRCVVSGEAAPDVDTYGPDSDVSTRSTANESAVVRNVSDLPHAPGQRFLWDGELQGDVDLH
ncbi:hypothetical protein K469DRAFT_706419 [Zopfia rhizophila CBS 207.26]|uniref:Uncharacterized protein n=1 Tax=Zopfia rhizophila CBS 207.26 TaxID=1314779 RepID=A0A6A6E7J3_9PEZI|nr:hypothetical protein K469DRAFT_706419 [Zopfia rhizophila CBS 207.26]